MTTFYTVYRTTKTDDGRFYIGVHKTQNPHDDYLGSGIHIKAAIKRGQKAIAICPRRSARAAAQSVLQISSATKHHVRNKLFVSPVRHCLNVPGSDVLCDAALELRVWKGTRLPNDVALAGSPFVYCQITGSAHRLLVPGATPNDRN